MRGEDARSRETATSSGGSPPHARGRLGVGEQRGHPQGITPACAGKTRAASAIFRPRTDHPRMRGEDIKVAVLRKSPQGSPPHARGRPGFSVRRRPGGRITPACAGKTNRNEIGRYAATGSPPHARGRLTGLSRKESSRGITPACAGKTVCRTSNFQLSPDHPRMRGEDWRRSVSSDGDSGSPPHARGRPPLLSCLTPSSRITPACAGKTCRTVSSLQPPWDHPRMRGEDHDKR